MTAELLCWNCGELSAHEAMECEHCGQSFGIPERDFSSAVRSLLGPRVFTCPTCKTESEDCWCQLCGRRLYETDFDTENNSGSEATFAGTVSEPQEATW